MEIIRIGDSGFKLSLNKSDMKAYGINLSALSSDTASGRKALRALLDEVKAQTGVDTAKRRTLLEAFPDKEGGCEIFMTLLCAEKKTKTALYRFESLAELCAAVGKLDAPPLGEESALYTMGDGSYFLSLPIPEEGSGRLFSPYSFFEEYGTRERNTLYPAYLREYGTCLCSEGALHYILSEKEDLSV